MKYNLNNVWKCKNEIIELIEGELNDWGWYLNKLKQSNNENQFQSLLLSEFSLLVRYNFMDYYIPEGFEMNNDIQYYDIFMININIPNNFKFPDKTNNIYLNNSIIGNNIILPQKCNYIYITKKTKFGDNITYPEKCNGIRFW